MFNFSSYFQVLQLHRCMHFRISVLLRKIICCTCHISTNNTHPLATITRQPTLSPPPHPHPTPPTNPPCDNFPDDMNMFIGITLKKGNRISWMENTHTHTIFKMNKNLSSMDPFNKRLRHGLVLASIVCFYIITHMYANFSDGLAELVPFMMTSSNGNIFRVTGHLCGEFTGPGEFPTQRPVTRSFEVFFDLRLNKRLSKQSWGWWFETLSRPLWRHCDVKLWHRVILSYGLCGRNYS